MLKPVFQKHTFQERQLHLQQLTKSLAAAEPEGMASFYTQLVEHQIKFIDLKDDHWRTLYHIILTIFNKSNIYQAYRNRDTTSELQKVALFNLLDELKDGQHSQEKYQFLVDQIKHYGSVQAHMLIQQQLLYYATRANIKYERFYPLTLRINAMILQQYLNIKKQKTSSTLDRLEHEVIVAIHCEEWIEQFLVGFIEEQSKILTANKNSRRYFLNFSFDVIEALLQNLLEGTLKENILKSLLQKIENSLLTHYSVLEILDTYIQGVRNVHYKHPIKPLEVVEIYQNDTLLNANGVCYIISKFISRPDFKYVHSTETVLRVLIPSVSESVRRTFPYKHDLINSLFDFVSKHNKVILKSDNQYNYPVSLLVLHLVEEARSKQNPKIQAIISHFSVNLRVLERLLDSNTETWVEQYVLDNLKVEQYQKSKKILTILSFKEHDQAYNQRLLTIYEKISNLKWVQDLIKQTKLTSTKSAHTKKRLSELLI